MVVKGDFHDPYTDLLTAVEVIVLLILDPGVVHAMVLVLTTTLLDIYHFILLFSARGQKKKRSYIYIGSSLIMFLDSIYRAKTEPLLFFFIVPRY